jgi:hypothetical protein
LSIGRAGQALVRVLADQSSAGGDEIIYSKLGDIDAGRGAKTVRVPSAPEIVSNADGVTEVLERADISGSGIGTIIGFPCVEPGDVSLIAPLGTINAGEAGIRLSGNLNLAALYVWARGESPRVTGLWAASRSALTPCRTILTCSAPLAPRSAEGRDSSKAALSRTPTGVSSRAS